MAQISNFEQIRADGNVVPAGMTVREMLARGWGPSKGIALRWLCDGEAIRYDAPQGVLGIVVQGANFIAAILDEDPLGTSRLAILSPDGSVRGKLENSLDQVGVVAKGRFSWFESAIAPSDDKFGVVFQTAAEGDFLCDVHARELRVLKVARVR